ncbi:TPA: hypothetical protein QEM72_001303 [Pseudomonas putida]|uniref:hypothetical protein n=1 Tax=Pseudomonas putida TaxID=303 RepID=UPI002363AC2D|nr:hypothetical protein [Pseudomonas putida]MDD2075595.1 hypothetical protein [Pseudomonas putida]HDS1690824.1 hypothetical protein [Pseudomonas putida]
MQEEPMKDLPDVDDEDQADTTEPPATLSRRKRGAAPVSGMPCESGYKQIGDDCIRANPGFE